MARRLNYFHHVLTVKPQELIARVYAAQKRRPVKDDWYLSVQNDLKEAQIELDDESIRKMKKNTFKNLVRNKIRKLAFESLKILKEGHSKGQEINYKQFEIQRYIKSEQLTAKQKSLLFNLRYRMVPNIKTNFRNMFVDMKCRL